MSLKLQFLLPMTVFAIIGCHKDNSTPHNSVSTMQISFSGVRTPGSVLTFSCDAPAGSTYLWDFGDGSGTSTEAAPMHRYTYQGNYQVSLTINNDATLRMEQTVMVVPDPLYTHLLAGTRTWHHAMYPAFHSGGGTQRPDTTMSISYIDPLTVLVGADTLIYNNSSPNPLTYLVASKVATPGSTLQVELQFYVSSNSISINHVTLIDSAGLEGTQMDLYSYP